MAAGQRDIPVLLQPGSGATVRAPGEFLYLKFADREIQAIITGQDGTQSRVKMVTGDFTKPAGGVSEIELVNPDTGNPCAVVVTVGDGEFDRKIIQGEVTITPGIRGADGQFVDDTRSTVRLRVAIGNIEPREYVAGDLVSTTVLDERNFLQPTWLPDNRLLLHAYQNGDEGEYRLITSDGQATSPTLLGQGPGVVIGPELWLPANENVLGTTWVVYKVYDVATLQFRRTVLTDLLGRTASGGPKLDAAEFFRDHLYQVQENKVFKIDLAGQVVGVIDYAADLGFQSDVAIALVRNGVLHISRTSNTWGSSLRVYDPGTLARLDASESQVSGVPSSLAAVMDREKDYVIRGYDNSFDDTSDIEAYALEDITITASGSVTSCAGGGFLKSSPIDTQAEIYTQRLDDGRVLMSGEILRAALEIYTGRYMPANYLDYVYRVRAENLNGISPRTVDSGGKSFLAAGIPDDASGTFPQTLEITLREGLL